MTATSIENSSCNILATGTHDGKIHLWDIATKSILQTIEQTKEISCIIFGNQPSRASTCEVFADCDTDISNSIPPVVNLLAIGTVSGGIRVHDINQHKIIRQFVGHRSEIVQLDFDCMNQFLATCSSDCNVKLWDMRQKNCAITYKGHESPINCVSFSPDGRWLVSGDQAGITKLWDISQGKAIHEFHDQFSVNDILFHPDELVLATASSGKIVRFWDLETWEHICRTPKVTRPVKKILFPRKENWNDTYAHIQINDDQNSDHDDSSNDENDGNCAQARFCVAATQDSLRLWRWEPQPVLSDYNIEVHVKY